MDLTADQFNRIKKFVDNWTKDKKYELETTFGIGGVVNSNTFLQIAQRMRTKDFEIIPQEDRLSIITPNHIRFSIEGLGFIQSYCKDNSLENKQFTAMIKDRAFSDSNIDIPEYNIRFKMRREEELSTNDPEVLALTNAWKTQKKAFRLIRRWSFQNKGIRVDMSIVRQTPTMAGKSEFNWSTDFLKYNILKEVPRYEVEVELLHGTEFTDTVEKSIKSLISGVGEVQRAIQKNSLLIRNSVSDRVRMEYKTLTGSDKFRGVGPVTLQLKNMVNDIDESIPNIRSGYNVTDKADGLRTMGYVDKTGELYLIDQSMNVYRTGLKNEKCAESLIDGEWVTLSNKGLAINHYLIFDIYYYMNNKKVTNLPFVVIKNNELADDESRYTYLVSWVETWKDGFESTTSITNVLTLILKNFEFATPNNTSIFNSCKSILNNILIYNTDGLIITSNSHHIPDRAGVRFPQQFKWKPSKDNTVDFLIVFERDDNNATDKISSSIDSVNSNTIQYKTMRLYVGGEKGNEHENPRATILRNEEIVQHSDKTIRYKPILFTPINFPDTMANTCNVKIEQDRETSEDYIVTEDSKEPIQNRSVVEMRYDSSREPGWRWVPSRIRHDKTERLIRAAAKPGVIKYSGIMNDEGVANDIWNSIHEPITLSMIKSGNAQPTDDEIKDILKLRESDISKKYYERKAPKENLALVKGLQDFHNKYIKNDILIKRSLLGGNKRLVDVACGKAGDLYKWKYNGAKYVLGVDMAGENITNISDGAYKRYLQLMLELGKQNVPNIAFAIGNSSKNIVSGEAGANNEERDILRSIFGKLQPEGPVPKYIKNVMEGSFRDGADVAACMFALHYFFESKETLDGFLTNISDIVKPGGYFIGCCFDGNKVFNLLRTTEMGHTKTGIEGDIPIWSITKEYDNEELSNDDSSIGLGINVEFISIGSAHKEYLVPFELLRSKMASIGFHLLDQNELHQLQLGSSTATFDTSFKMAKQSGKKFNMIPTVQEFSFLNRWFIFKRYGVDYDEKKEAPSDMQQMPSEPLSRAPIARFPKDLTAKYPKYAKFSVVPSSSYSVLKPWEERYVNKILDSWFNNKSELTYIIDATAHIGVDSIHLSDVFSNAQVHSYEIVPAIYNSLEYNIKAFGKTNIIYPHRADITLWEPSESDVVDLLYVDPPWGGPTYKDTKVGELKMYLQAEGTAPNESKNIDNLINKWLNTNKIHNIILKAPFNFDMSYLKSNYTVSTGEVLNRAGKLAYYLLLIKSKYNPADVSSKDVAVPSAAPSAPSTASSVVPSTQLGGLKNVDDENKEDSENKDDVNYEDDNDAIILKSSEVFSFGPSAIDNKKVMNKSGEFDKYAGRYISPSMHLPIPIPDRDNKKITYPTIDHYMAGMRLKLSAPELAITVMSTNGDIHQTTLFKLESHKIQESDRYYDILCDENKLIKKYKYKATKQDERWIREKDEHLKYAINHRLKTDGYFKEIVYAAKDQHKYLLYHVKGTNDASEYSGARTQQGHIKGENKMGKFIMNIAQFKHVVK